VCNLRRSQVVTTACSAASTPCVAATSTGFVAAAAPAACCFSTTNGSLDGGVSPQHFFRIRIAALAAAAAPVFRFQGVPRVSPPRTSPKGLYSKPLAIPSREKQLPDIYVYRASTRQPASQRAGGHGLCTRPRSGRQGRHEEHLRPRLPARGSPGVEFVKPRTTARASIVSFTHPPHVFSFTDDDAVIYEHDSGNLMLRPEDFLFLRDVNGDGDPQKDMMISCGYAISELGDDMQQRAEELQQRIIGLESEASQSAPKLDDNGRRVGSTALERERRSKPIEGTERAIPITLSVEPQKGGLHAPTAGNFFDRTKPLAVQDLGFLLRRDYSELSGELAGEGLRYFGPIGLAQLYDARTEVMNTPRVGSDRNIGSTNQQSNQAAAQSRKACSTVDDEEGKVDSIAEIGPFGETHIDNKDEPAGVSCLTCLSNLPKGMHPRRHVALGVGRILSPFTVFYMCGIHWHAGTAPTFDEAFKANVKNDYTRLLNIMYMSQFVIGKIGQRSTPPSLTYTQNRSSESQGRSYLQPAEDCSHVRRRMVGVCCRAASQYKDDLSLPFQTKRVCRYTPNPGRVVDIPGSFDLAPHDLFTNSQGWAASNVRLEKLQANAQRCAMATLPSSDANGVSKFVFSVHQSLVAAAREQRVTEEDTSSRKSDLEYRMETDDPAEYGDERREAESTNKFTRSVSEGYGPEATNANPTITWTDRHDRASRISSPVSYDCRSTRCSPSTRPLFIDGSDTDSLPSLRTLPSEEESSSDPLAAVVANPQAQSIPVNPEELERQLERIARPPSTPNNRNWPLLTDWSNNHAAFVNRVRTIQNNDAIAFIRQANTLLAPCPAILDLVGMQTDAQVDVDVEHRVTISDEYCTRFADFTPYCGTRLRDSIDTWKTFFSNEGGSWMRSCFIRTLPYRPHISNPTSTRGFGFSSKPSLCTVNSTWFAPSTIFSAIVSVIPRLCLTFFTRDCSTRTTYIWKEVTGVRASPIALYQARTGWPNGSELLGSRTVVIVDVVSNGTIEAVQPEHRSIFYGSTHAASPSFLPGVVPTVSVWRVQT
ncbi:hypothetical protein C8R47DRAFT_1267022, partial [Mycena vitilis]